MNKETKQIPIEDVISFVYATKEYCTYAAVFMNRFAEALIDAFKDDPTTDGEAIAKAEKEIVLEALDILMTEAESMATMYETDSEAANPGGPED